MSKTNLTMNVTTKVVRILASRWFFYGTVALFLLNALWIAFSFRYPMLFDTAYHQGIINFYAHHWSPFLNSQPTTLDQYGNVMSNPSFLYHYLMSFPYRLFTAVGMDTYAHVIGLRVISISFVALGLLLFRSVLLRANLPRSMVHVALLLFILMPITPFLAAQNNYDNMLFPLAALSILLCQEILRRKNISYLLVVTFLGVAMVSAMVKYTFLPLLVAEVAFVGIVLGRRHGWVELGKAFTQSFTATPKKRRLVVAALFVIIGCVFAGRYGGNIIRYGTPSPECDQVLSIERCKNYGVWYRNYKYAQEGRHVSKDPTIFSHVWSGTMREDMFRVGANIAPTGTAAYSPVYRVMKMVAGFTVSAGAILGIYYWRTIRRSLMAWFFITVSGAYVGALWLQNYVDYIHTGQYVGTQGRYLLPVLPLMVGLLLMGYAEYVKKNRKRQTYALWFLLFVLICFTQGGGAIASIAAGNPSWYWPNSRMNQANQQLQKVIKPLVHT